MIASRRRTRSTVAKEEQNAQNNIVNHVEHNEIEHDGQVYEEIVEQQMPEEHVDVEADAPITVDDEPPLLVPQKQQPVDDEQYVTVQDVCV